MSDPLIITNQVGSIGHILLNRPKALNALNLEMVEMMQQALERWATDSDVTSVVVSGTGDKSFCSGGDVKSVYLAGIQGQTGDGTLTADFFRAEYTLNHFIANYPKPYIAFMDGITMGGGVGIAIRGSHRIATDRTIFAMPETGIGFFPDVGGSYFMSRAGNLGLLLALTGRPLRAREVLDSGFATHYIESVSATELISGIDQLGPDAYLANQAVDHSKLKPAADLEKLRELADLCFQCTTVEAILQSLDNVASQDGKLSSLASEIHSVLNERSPTSLKVTLEQLKRGKDLSFAACLQMEYRLSQACMAGHDFYEGIRAVLVDKDHSPGWSPASLSEIDSSIVDKHFADLGERELKL